MNLNHYKRKMMHCLAAAIAGAALFMPAAVSEAKMVTVEADGYYLLGDDDSIAAAKSRARQDALRMAAEKAGVFVSSYSKTNNLSLTADEIIVISSNLLNVQKESVSNESVNGQGFKINCHVVACFDTDNLDTMKTLNTQTLAIKKKDDELEALNRENARLKLQLANDSKARLKANEDVFTIKLYEREMLKAANNARPEEAAQWAAKIKELDPDNPVLRNYAYFSIKDPKRRIEECDKYLASHPGDFVAEINRINALFSLEEKFPVKEKDKIKVKELIDKAKKILPQDVYYASISPTVIRNEIVETGPLGVTLDEQIYFLFERIYGMDVNAVATVNKGKKEKDILMLYTRYPGDTDGKEFHKILSKYEKVYFS